MKRRLLTITTICVLVAGFVSAAPTRLLPIPAPIVTGLEQSGKKEQDLVWQDSLESAMKIAVAEYQPVFVLFSSTSCKWCRRMKDITFEDPKIKSLLQHFALVEVDVGRDRETAALYQVSGVPTVIVLSSDGRVRESASGYLPVPILRSMLNRVLNPAFVRKTDAAFLALIELLDSGEVSAEKWPEIMNAMGEESHRKAIHDKIFAREEFPQEVMVGLLEDSRLAVRLGALELLEERVGDTFGYDPWLDDESVDSNKDAVARLKGWKAKDGENDSVRFSALTETQLRSYLQDLISDDRHRSLRAMRMLEQGGQDMAKHLLGFLEENTSLPDGVIKRVKEVRYSIMVPSLMGLEPSVFAHRLVFGTLDARLKGISALRGIGKRAIPIVVDYLADEDPIIRETSVDVLTAIGGKRVAVLLDEHLKSEKDDEVVFAILKGLGKMRSKVGLAILKRYTSSPNEDLAIASLNSIANLKTKLVIEDVEKCLDDSRWRVRVAALEAAGKLKLVKLKQKVGSLLDDKDDFVRYSAVSALVKISADKEQLKKLEEAYLREDVLKGPVAAAFGSLDKKLPDSFGPALKGKSNEVLLAVLESLESCGSSGLTLGSQFIDHENLDVSCSAIRLVASGGMTQSKYQEMITKVLESGEKEKVLAALESISIESRSSYGDPFGSFDLTPISLDMGPAIKLDGDTNAAANVESVGIDDLFGAFEDEPAKPVAVEPVAPAPAPVPKGPAVEALDIDDLFGSFEDADAPTGGTAVAGTAAKPVSKGMAGLKEEIRRHMDESKDPAVQFAAALMLTKIGEASALPFLAEGLSDRTVLERQSIAQVAGRLKGSNVKPILLQLLDDPAKSVRASAVRAMLTVAEKSAGELDALFQELQREGTKLEVYDIFGDYRLSSMHRGKPSLKRALRKWAATFVAAEGDNVMQNFGLIMYSRCWKSGDEKVVEKFLKSSDPFQRRAAFYAIGKNNKKLLVEKLDDLTSDSSEYVRLVLPSLYMKMSSTWLHYLDKTHFDNEYDYYSSYNRRKKSMSPEIKAVLLKLTEDKSPKVRIESFICLLSNRVSIDLALLVETIDAFPDRDAIASRIGDYVVENYAKLGDAFKVLLPYLQNSRRGEESLDKVRKHFNVSDIEDDSLTDLVYRKSEKRSLPATFLEVEDQELASSSNVFRAVYFSSAGCSDCARVDEMLTKLKVAFPTLQVEKLDIKKVAVMRMNEALSDRFNVPSKVRLVTPAIFAGGGFLIKKEISFSRLGELLSRSSVVPLESWHTVSEEDLQKAEEAIGGRYAAMGMGLVVLAGLLDGVNPCAFATIIFLLSYLQVTQRKPREILQVGLAFISAVFLAYFILGFGLVEVISRMSVLQHFGKIVTWLMALMALVVMAFSLRDGILCMRGQMGDMTLQLPEFLKKRIHTVIRKGSRHSHFVVAAFVAGIVISFLELACTGQVYAPTILFMLKTGKDTLGAVSYLLVYNVAFVLPLIFIFGLAYGGLKSGTLTDVMRKHAAMVKFCTAILFFFLFIFLIFGNKIMTILH